MALRGGRNGPALAGRRTSVETVVLPCRHQDLLEDGLVESGPLPPDGGRVEEQQPVEPYLARAALTVPGAGADVHPVATPAGLVGGVTVMVLAGEHEAHPA